MCFSLSPWCSRKGEENGNAPGPGKVLFTGCMSTQTLERGICFYTYKAALFRAVVMRQDAETPHGSDSASPSGLLLTGCVEELSRKPFSCCLSAGCVKQQDPGLQHAPGLLLSQPDLRLPCWAQQCAPVSQVSAARPRQGYGGAVTQEPLPVTREEIRPLLQTRVSASQIIGGIFSLSDKAGDSYSLLLLIWVCVAKISPSWFNPTTSTGLHKST